MGIENVNILQDQDKYKGDEPVKEDGPKVVEQNPAAPLDPTYVKDQQDAEARKQSELEEARQEHNRRTAGGDPVGE